MRTDLYDILEVSPDASQTEIKAAMTKLGNKYAAKAQSNTSVRLRFNQITEAYQVISNPYRRASYNNFLAQHEEIKNNTYNFDLELPDIKTYTKQQFIEKWSFTKRIWRLSTLLFFIVWHFIKKWLIKLWQFIKKNSIIQWHISKHKTWQICRAAKLQSFITIRAFQKIQAGEQLTSTGWRNIGNKDTSMYIRRSLITGEKIVYQAYPHWLFYVDFIGLIFFLTCSYLLLNEPMFTQQNIPKLVLWIPWLEIEYLEISVWSLGLGTLVFIGVMVIWEAFVDNKTTELIITSKRVFHKNGLLSLTAVELKLNKFESITVKQSFAGIIFNYGTITITGMSRVQTTIHHIVAPLKFKKQLWQVLEQ